jgi:hypothetical protein
MRLPNPGRAVVEMVKLRDYCLNPSHPRGRHKARVFASALGLTGDHAEVLRQALLRAAREQEAVRGEADDFGQRYVLEFTMTGPDGEARIRSGWIVRHGENFPRLTSCYVAS